MNDKWYVFIVDMWNGSSVITRMITARPSKTGDGTKPTQITAGILDPGLLKFVAFSSGKTFGKSDYSYGVAVVNNNNRDLDYLKAYSFDGRSFKMFEGSDVAVFPSGFTQVYTATIDSVSFAWDQIAFTLRGRQAEFDVPLPSGIFAGTNAPPLGIEGGDSLKGKYKPFLLGRAFNFKPVICNDSKLIYAVSPATGIAVQYMGSLFHVYDKRVLLGFGGLYSDQTDMETNEPLSGTYKVWEEGGYFRTGMSVTDLTCDAVNFGRSVTARPANLIADLLTLAGFSYDTTSITNLNNSFRSEVGVYIPAGGATIAFVIDAICSSCGAYWYFDAVGTFMVKQFVDPATLSPEYTLNTSTDGIETVSIEQTRDTAGGVPAHILTLLRSKNYTIQTDVAGIVTEESKTWSKETWRKTQVIDETVKTAHPSSEELIIETTLTCITQDDTAEAERRAALYSVERDLIVLNVPLDIFGSTANLVPGLCIALELEDVKIDGTEYRYGYTSKNMAVIGFTINRVSERIDLTLWG
jgi:hypothetical protein